MKKMFLISALVLFVLPFYASAQDTRIGASAGITVSDVSGTVNEMNHTVKTGFIASILVDYPIGKRVAFQPSLSYVQKGNVKKEDATGRIINALRYAELNPNFLFNINTSPTRFYIGAGPSIAFNLPSKQVTDPNEGDKSYRDITFGKTMENDFKGFDYGVNFIAGVRFSNHIFFNASYNLGLRNLSTNETDGSSIKNTYFAFQMGYLFK